MMNKILFVCFGLIASIIFAQSLQIKELTKQNSRMESVINTQIESQKILKKNFENYQVDVAEINKEFNKYRTEVSKVEKKLSKHNLVKLVAKKPKLMENVFNKGTDKVFKEIEEASRYD